VRTLSILAAGAAFGAVLVVAGAPASASPGAGFKINPDKVVQGGTVTVTSDNACAGATEAYADSPAIFDRIKMTDKGRGILRGSGTVRRDAPVGAHVVYVVCGSNGTISLALTVTAAQTKRTPKGGAGTGGGGTAQSAGSATNGLAAATGLGIVLLGAAGTGVRVVRRRRRSAGA
jgi:hypothetical protein